MSDDKEPPGCECKYPHSCEKCWPSVTQAQLDAAIKPQSAGATPREWQAWQIMDGVQLDTMRSDKLFIEHSAHLALERERDDMAAENLGLLRLIEGQANQLAEAGRKLRVSNACDSAAQERIASLEAERDRMRGALEKIAAGGTVTRRMCEDIAQAALKADPTDWQGPTQSGPERIAYLERELAKERVKLMQDPRVRE